jgi:c-di-GMP-binding flagellar brake protein YcgR
MVTHLRPAASTSALASAASSSSSGRWIIVTSAPSRAKKTATVLPTENVHSECQHEGYRISWEGNRGERKRNILPLSPPVINAFLSSRRPEPWYSSR